MEAFRQDQDAPESLLILKPSSFGDIIHTLPAVMLLRKHWPETSVTWMVNAEWAPLLLGSAAVDRVVLFPRRELRGLRGMSRFPGWLRENISALRARVAVDYQGLLRSAIIGWCTKPRRFYGLEDAREGARWFYDETARPPEGVPHAVERYLCLSETVVGVQEAPGQRLEFPLPPGEEPAAALGLPADYVLLHPFARGAGKSLSVGLIRDLCDGCRPHPVVMVGRSSEPLGQLPSNCYNLLNHTSLTELIWLIRRAAFVVSVDSGPAHLAAALGRPMVAIHTWSDPLKVGPYRMDAWVCKYGRLLRFGDVKVLGKGFIDRRPVDFLPRETLDEICRLATSPSNFCA